MCMKAALAEFASEFKPLTAEEAAAGPTPASAGKPIGSPKVDACVLRPLSRLLTVGSLCNSLLGQPGIRNCLSSPTRASQSRSTLRNLQQTHHAHFRFSGRGAASLDTLHGLHPAAGSGKAGMVALASANKPAAGGTGGPAPAAPRPVLGAWGKGVRPLWHHASVKYPTASLAAT